MGFEIRPIRGTFAAEVVGIDLRTPLDAKALARLGDGFLEHHVLVFRGQDLDKRAQLALTRQFGDPDEHAAMNAGDDLPQVHTVSNLDAEGQPDPGRLGSTHWHSDKSYRQIPSTATFLHAVQLPGQGGDTCFADTASAFESLDAARRTRLAGLRVVHDWARSVQKTSGGSISEAERRRWPPVAHPLARTQPGGRKALFIGQHASHIEGLPLSDGEALLDELLAHCTNRAFVYRHRWRHGDLLMWDNRCLLHRAEANFDTAREARVLHRTVTRGTSVPS